MDGCRVIGLFGLGLRSRCFRARWICWRRVDPHLPRPFRIGWFVLSYAGDFLECLVSIPCWVPVIFGRSPWGFVVAMSVPSA